MARTALALVASLALAVFVASGSSSVLAADPSAAPSAEAPGDANIEAWIDFELPPDVPVGRQITVGFTIWDRESHSLSRVGGEVRVHPKTGKAAATTAPTRSDWPG